MEIDMKSFLFPQIDCQNEMIFPPRLYFYSSPLKHNYIFKQREHSYV